MLFSESLQLIPGRVISRAKMQSRFVVLPGEIHGLQRAAGQCRSFVPTNASSRGGAPSEKKRLPVPNRIG
jgi:hypothetical protein